MADEPQDQPQPMDGQNSNGEGNEEHKMETRGAADDEEEDDRKVFVGGLSWETTTKDLREYFEKYGEVANCTLKTDFETKKSRGFGFVTFGTLEGVEKALGEKEHKLHGRTIDPKPANPRPVNKKIFVGKVDPVTTEDTIKEYFSQFGPIEKVELPFDKTKDQRRGFVFVEFSKLSSMKKCLEQLEHKLGTQVVDVKKATPPGGAPGTMGAGMRGGPRGRGFGPGNRGARGGYPGGYGYGPNYGYGNSYGYGSGYDQSYGYGGYGGDYYSGGGYYGGNWNGYDQSGYGYGYGGDNYDGYDEWGYGQGGGNQSNYGKAQKRGAGHGGYHPYNR